ncbi:hypothetical protein Fot_33560 [Forsythia ovata]|uniref:Uncharacterized protein n=1 Tax=Forsythia ovata TaxID=205694 RepID=A0ABD1TBI6_9LAMI
MTPSVYITCRKTLGNTQVKKSRLCCGGILIEELRIEDESLLIKKPRLFYEGLLIKSLASKANTLIKEPRIRKRTHQDKKPCSSCEGERFDQRASHRRRKLRDLQSSHSFRMC